MKIQTVFSMAAACAILFGSAAVDSQTPPAATSPVASSSASQEELKFGFDDLMTLLIQPRHLKLYYAGNQGNWELAAAQSRNLRGAMLRISQGIPRYLNLSVQEATASLFIPFLTALDAAIASADPKRFAAAYGDMTAACNACHVYMEHPYLVIKVPDTGASAHPNQDFRSLP